MNSAGCRARSIAWRISAMRLVTPVRDKLFFDHGRIDAAAPVTTDKLDLEGEVSGHLAPQRCEVPGLEHEHAIARGERVDQCRLPRPGARRRIDDHRPGGLENRFQPVEDRQRQARELGPAMIDGGVIDRPQHPVGDVGGPGNLQEMATAGVSVEAKHEATLVADNTPFYPDSALAAAYMRLVRIAASSGAMASARA